MTNDEHIHNFTVAIHEAIAQCDDIMRHLDDHCGIAPDDVTIGHVYNVKHVNTLLNEIQTFLGMGG